MDLGQDLVPYSETAWLDDASASMEGTLDNADRPSAVIVRGVCPRCTSHVLTDRVDLARYLSSQSGVAAGDEVAAALKFVAEERSGSPPPHSKVHHAPLVVVCGCEYLHPGAPENHLGCGAHLSLHAEWGLDPQEPKRVRLTAGQPLTSQRIETAREWTELSETELTDVRTAAQGWRAALAGVIALATTAGVVRGKASISALLPAYQYAVGGLTLLAIVTAGVGTFFATRAAFGLPRKVTLDEFEGTSRRHLKRSAESAKDLRTAMVLTYLALALLVAAIAFAWYGEANTSPQTM